MPDEDPNLMALMARFNAISEAFSWAARDIAAVPDPQTAFEYATKLGELMRLLAEGAADLRAQQVHRIWTAEELTLAKLGERIGVSGPRAYKLIQAGQPPAVQPQPTEEENPT